MFEIGSALREARERRGLSYSQVEEETKIRGRYIRALEDEDFGVLPGSTYTKGFLRAYADYLGLDGHLFIDEFNSRYHDPRTEDEQPIYPPSRRKITRQRRETNIVLIALAGIVAVASIFFVFGFVSDTPHRPLPTPPSTSHSSNTTPHTSSSFSTNQTSKKTQHQAPKAYRIQISAANGDSYLTVHLRTAHGPDATSVHGTDLGNYLLHQGEVADIRATGPVYLSLGRPSSVTVSVAGKQRTLPPGFTFTITRSGVTRAA